MRSRSILGVVPALGFSLIPTLTCPACLPALASVLGAVGLTFVAQREYLLWLNLAALLAALLLLARSERRWTSIPLATAATGASAVMVGKFVWINSWLWWAGLSVFVLGSAWSSARRISRGACNECESVQRES